MVRRADDPDDGAGHQVNTPGVGKLHQLSGDRDETAQVPSGHKHIRVAEKLH